MTPRTLHLIFKTHLDIGFTRQAHEVVEAYLDHYIPAAIALARELAADGGRERFVWTTGSWLINEALEVYKGERRRALEQALGQGHLAWHGLPFTTHTEYLDASLIRHGLSLSQGLDRRFGRTTIAAKMTDVPGHTVALVPLLAEAGIRFLHLGVNPASTVPAVPPCFRWQHAGAEITVMYSGSYGETAVLPGLDHGLAFGHTGDNHGPQSATEVRAQFAKIQAEFPGADVSASTLDAFALALTGNAAVQAALPIITDEIGDTWIHGVGTDPHKTKRFRALVRWRAKTLAANPSLAQRRDLRRFSTRLLLVGEHTWGRDTKHWDVDHGALTGSFAPAAFAAERAAGVHDEWEASWQEQRAYIDQAIDCLSGSTLQSSARLSQSDVVEAPPVGASPAVSPASAADLRLTSGALSIAADPNTGELTLLQTPLRDGSSRNWAGRFGSLLYQVFGSEDYDRCYQAYNPNRAGTDIWAFADFHKPGLEQVLRVGKQWRPRVIAATRHGERLLFRLTFAPEAVAFGCPAEFTLSWRITGDTVHAELGWARKTACRIPEALWFGFNANAAPAGWRLRKLDSLIDPLQVISKGNRGLHAVWGAEHVDGLRFATPDAGLLAPGTPRLVSFTDAPADPAAGLHVNLWNNTWGTNFPMWYDEDASFSFSWTCA